jgi:hypothetical protein
MSEIQLIVIGIPGSDGFLNLLEDFPHEVELDADFGMTVGEIQSEPWYTGTKTKRRIGKDENGNDLWVDLTNVPVKTDIVTTPGVLGVASVEYNGRVYNLNYRPPQGVVPFVGIQACSVYNLDAAIAINAGSYRVLAAWTRDPADAPAAIEDWGPLNIMSEGRWLSIRNPLVNSLGVEALIADGWWNNENVVHNPINFISALIAHWKSQQ